MPHTVLLCLVASIKVKQLVPLCCSSRLTTSDARSMPHALSDRDEFTQLPTQTECLVAWHGERLTTVLCKSVCIPLTLHGTALEEGRINSTTNVPSPTHKLKSRRLKWRVPQDRFRRSASVNGIGESSLLNWHSALSISSCHTTEVEKSYISSFHIPF